MERHRKYPNVEAIKKPMEGLKDLEVEDGTGDAWEDEMDLEDDDEFVFVQVLHLLIWMLAR